MPLAAVGVSLLAIGLFVGLCVLAIIVLVGLGLLLKWRAFRRAVGVVLLIMFGLPAVLLLIARVGNLDRPRRIVEAPFFMAPMMTSWSQAMDRTFAEAVLHPSAASTARALAWRLAERLDEVFSKNCEPKQIRVVDDPAATEFVDVFIEALRQQELGPIIVRCSASESEYNVGLCDVTAELERIVPSTQGSTDGQRFGGLEVAGWLNSPHAAPHRVPFRISAMFVDKRWVDDFAGFASAEPDREWLVAYSSEVTDSRDRAHQQALSVAAAKLRPYLRDYLRGQPSRQMQRLADYPANVLDAEIAATLRSGHLVADRFVQRVRRPYGDVWREALLIHASADWIASMGVAASNRLAARQVYIAAKAGSERAQWMRMVLSIAGLIALICVMYLFLNFATKGYYVWALRGAAVVIAAAVVLLALNWW